jgi:signal transduction histidine kinase
MIVNDFQPVVLSKQQTLEFIPDAHLPACRIDAMKFSRAVLNLVQNAVNYTPTGGKIVLRSGVEDHQLVLSITDNGIGIDEQDLPHIFDRFYRADSARTSSTGGSGLGLPISKRIIEIHQGEITVESIPNHSTTFRIKLPLPT